VVGGDLIMGKEGGGEKGKVAEEESGELLILMLVCECSVAILEFIGNKRGVT
jgi:hypothetical protein